MLSFSESGGNPTDKIVRPPIGGHDDLGLGSGQDQGKGAQVRRS